ncbi:hypothetical protein PRLR6025_09250 [Prevotella lacticifex]|uniref:DUF4468 domain-containing protein n=1 Tax=Prevotella lacticifex TaxID=2854755 RepID=UPI001CC6916C|nr:DUF4468 domain-containing protein [Prevotella lacticifex]GJG67456.1 hypothetical protein PRLR6025_09250 [Prevotella lacticifex]
MKKIILFIFMALSMMAAAQSTLTPQEELEKAQKQLEEAQKALNIAKANAAKAQQEAKARQEAEARAKADAEAKAKTEAIRRKIDEMKKETARLQEETAKVNAENSASAPAPTVSTPVSSEPKRNETVSQKDAPANKQDAAVTKQDEAESTTEAQKPVASKKKEKIRTRLAPTGDDDDNETDMSIYLAKDAVPEVNGKVEWTNVISAPGKSADELYRLTDEYLTKLTSDELQLEGSQVAIKNPAKHNLTATVHEWLVFKNSALSLDRTEFYYILNATCSNGKVEMSMSRVRYKYDVQGKTDIYTAEDWITDKNSVNKKRTRLYPISGKFRKKTIDRKNEIFQTLEEFLQK